MGAATTHAAKRRQASAHSRPEQTLLMLFILSAFYVRMFGDGEQAGAGIETASRYLHGFPNTRRNLITVSKHSENSEFGGWWFGRQEWRTYQSEVGLTEVRL